MLYSQNANIVSCITLQLAYKKLYCFTNSKHLFFKCFSLFRQCTTDSCPDDVHMELLWTSVYKVLACIFATATNICTEGSSMPGRSNMLERH